MKIGARIQMWVLALMTVLLAGAPRLAWPQGVIPAGTTDGMVQEREIAPRTPVAREEAQPEVPVAPKFAFSMTGSDVEMAQQAFLEYARAIGQEVDLLTYGGKLGVYLQEETDSSRDAFGGIIAEAGRHFTRGRVNLQTGDRRTLTLTGQIREGQKIHYIRSSSKTGRRVRVEFSAWSGWWNQAFAGRDTDPQTRLRAEAVRDLVPQLMEEMQRIVLQEAAAKEAAARERERAAATSPNHGTTRSPARSGYEYELLTSMDNSSNRTIATTRPLRVGQSIKVMRGSKRVGTITVRYFAEVDRIAVQGDSTLAADPSTTLVPAA